MKISKILLPLIPLIVAIFGLEALRRFQIVPEYLLPTPSEISKAFIEDRTELFDAFLSTAGSSLAALALSFVVGTLVATALSLSTILTRAVYPYAVFFQTVPIIAIAPLLVIWFGFGRPTVIASAFIVSVFPVIASTLLGIESTDSSLMDLFRLYRAPALARLWKLRLPFAMPMIFSGLRIAAGLSVIGAIVGEFIAGGGLGSVVDAARTQQRIDIVFAAVLLSALLGLVIVGAIDLVSRFALRNWHVSVHNRANS